MQRAIFIKQVILPIAIIVFVGVSVVILDYIVGFYSGHGAFDWDAFFNLPTYLLAIPIVSIIFITVTSIWIGRHLYRAELLKYEFINIVTHKFRTPLTYVKWSAENLRKAQSEEERLISIKQIENAGDRLMEMTDILIDMARIDDGSSYVFRAESVRELVEQVLLQYAPRLKEKNLRLSIDIAPQLPLMSIDVKRIQFVVQTLIENAIIYTPKEGLVELSVKMRGERALRFSIHDSGIGISSGDLPHVFNKFFRSKKATGTDTEGMGLGLFIAKNIIERHGGKMWAESEGENHGATFSFELYLH